VDLVLLAIVGSAALAGIAFWLGFNKNLKLQTFDDIKPHLGSINPVTWVVATDGGAALVRDVLGELYLLRVVGDKVVRRPIEGKHLRARGEGHVHIDIGDLGFPALDFQGDPSTLIDVLTTKDQLLS
jgi:hypothetical protein